MDAYVRMSYLGQMMEAMFCEDADGYECQANGGDGPCRGDFERRHDRKQTNALLVEKGKRKRKKKRWNYLGGDETKQKWEEKERYMGSLIWFSLLKNIQSMISSKRILKKKN